MHELNSIRYAAFVDELSKIAASMPGPMSAALFAGMPHQGAVTQLANAVKAKNTPAMSRIGGNIMDAVKSMGPKGVASLAK